MTVNEPAFLRTPARSFILLGILIFAVFGLACWAPFIYDDTALLISYAEVIGPWQGWKHWFITPLLESSEWEPLGVLINRLIYQNFGSSPLPFRLTSILLHWACASAFFSLARTQAKSQHALAAAVLFALFPAHIEVVAVATFKKHLIVTLCAFLFLRLSLAKSNRWSHDVAMAALFALSLLAKETGFVLPMLLVAWKIALPAYRHAWKLEARLAILLSAVAISYLAFRIFVIPRTIEPLVGSPLLHLLTSGKCFLWYLSELALPFRICQEHSLKAVGALRSWQAAGILAGLISYAALVAALWRRDRLLGLAAAWIAITLLPFLNLVPYLNLSLVANRYLYLPSAGLALAMARALDLWGPKRGMALGLGTALVALPYAAMAMSHLSRYAAPLELWEKACACAPDNPRAYINLANFLVSHGRYEEAQARLKSAQALAQAESTYETAAIFMLAELFARTGRNEQALELVRGNFKRYPAGAHLIGGVALMGLNRHAQALPQLELAYKQFNSAQAKVWLGQCLYELGRHDRLDKLWGEALDDPEWHAKAAMLLGQLYSDRSEFQRSRTFFEMSASVDPLNLDTALRLAQVHRKLGNEEAAAKAIDRVVFWTARKLEDAHAFGGDAAGWTARLHDAQRAKRAFFRR